MLLWILVCKQGTHTKLHQTRRKIEHVECGETSPNILRQMQTGIGTPIKRLSLSVRFRVFDWCAVDTHTQSPCNKIILQPKNC